MLFIIFGVIVLKEIMKVIFSDLILVLLKSGLSVWTYSTMYK